MQHATEERDEALAVPSGGVDSETAERLWLLKLLEDPERLAWVKEQVRRAEAFHAAFGPWEPGARGLPEVRGVESAEGGDERARAVPESEVRCCDSGSGVEPSWACCAGDTLPMGGAR